MLFSSKTMLLLWVVVAMAWVDAAETVKAEKETAKAVANKTETEAQAAHNETEEVDEKLEPGDVRSSACLLLYLIRTQKDAETLKRFNTSNANETAARTLKLKALIVSHCNRTIPQDAAAKVLLPF